MVYLIESASLTMVSWGEISRFNHELEKSSEIIGIL